MTPGRYALARCAAALTATGLLALVSVTEAAVFYGQYFSWYDWQSLAAPALVTLIPPLVFALGSGWDEAAARRLLAELGLSDAEDRPVREWSGGMKRRLALARALLADAEAIALDEPFAGLDAENRRHGAECIARRAETTPVLLVTHDRADLEALNARIIELRQGEIRRGSTS